MVETTLAELLARNGRHVESLPADYFDGVRDGQTPAAVSVCCSDSRVPQERMWDVTEPGWLFTPSTIGNQVWDRHGGERVVDGSVLYPLVYADTAVAVVVGHTGCGAVTAALEAVRQDGVDAPVGVSKWIEELVPVVEAGLADERVRGDGSDDAALVDRLVEYNVDQQVAFLDERDVVPDDVAVYGFVYDFLGRYGDAQGRAYLVNAGGVRDPVALADRVPAQYADAVARLVEPR